MKNGTFVYSFRNGVEAAKYQAYFLFIIALDLGQGVQVFAHAFVQFDGWQRGICRHLLLPAAQDVLEGQAVSIPKAVAAFNEVQQTPHGFKAGRTGVRHQAAQMGIQLLHALAVFMEQALPHLVSLRACVGSEVFFVGEQHDDFPVRRQHLLQAGQHRLGIQYDGDNKRCCRRRRCQVPGL